MMDKPRIISVDRVVATDEAGLDVHIQFQTPDGEIQSGIHYLTETDPHGFSPELRQYLIDYNPVIEPYVPPTKEEWRANLPAITKKALRLTLIRNGITLSSVRARIEAIENELERDEALTEWDDSESYERMHPLLIMVAVSLGLTDEQIDTMWLQAIDIMYGAGNGVHTTAG